MAADILTSLATWSTSEGSNLPSGTTAISTNLDDNLRMIQSVVRYTMASDTIASATTTDLGTKESQYLTVSGTTTITSLGTISAGIAKYVTFSGALLLTHNATSLILPSATSITTAAGDTARFLSLGSGNWKCLSYTKASGLPIISSPVLADGTAAAPSLYFTADTNTGLYRIGADSLGFTANGSKVAEMSAANGFVVGTTLAVSTAGAFAVTPSAGQTISFTPNAAGFLVNGTSLIGSSVVISAGTAQALTLIGGDGSGATAGNVNITGGTSVTGIGGGVNISGGSGSGGGNDISLRCYGSASVAGNVYIAQGGTLFYKFRGRSKHVEVLDSGNTPTITAGGGTSPVIQGSDNAFKITVGSGGTAQTVTVTFNQTWANQPMVIAQHQGASLPLFCSASTTTVQIQASSAFTAGGVIDVMCIGRE